MWDKVDRVMKKFKVATGARARKAFEHIVEGNSSGKLRQQGLKQHLATVYQRFLDPKDKRARTVRMSVNGSAVAAWDPFCESVSRLEGDDEADVPCADGKMAPIRIRGFILPRREEFPTPAQADAALIENDRQGIYVYRENRLIHGPDWLTFYVKEPHMTLFRVEFSFDHRLDDAFQIDIKKSQIILDENIATFVTDYIVPDPRIIDAAAFVPQHRERIFIVGFREDCGFDWARLALPPKPLHPKLDAVLHRHDEAPEAHFTAARKGRTFVSDKYTLSDHLWSYLQAYAEKHRQLGHGFGCSVFQPSDIARTLSARYHKDGSEILIAQKGKNPRRLTPRECARLMGFPDSFQIPVSDTQAYRQFGNSVVVPVIAAIAKQMAAAMRGEQLPFANDSQLVMTDIIAPSMRAVV